MIEIRLLGSPLLQSNGVDVRVDGAKTRALLTLLALRRRQTVSLDRLADEMWSGRPPPSAEGSLHAHVSRLRRVLGGEGGLLVTVRPGYQLDVGPEAVDTAQFDALHQRALTLAAAGHARKALEEWQQSLDLWTSDPRDRIKGFASAALELDRLEELRLTACEGVNECRLALGQHSSAIPDLLPVVEEYPGRECLWVLLIAALYADGRQAEALAAYERVRRFLLEEYGVEPGPDLRAAQAAVLAHEAVLPRRLLAHQARVGVAPVPLAAQRPGRADAPELVGRDTTIHLLDQWWSGRPDQLQVVSGAAGIGKTRVSAEFAARVHGQGGLVLWGRCFAEATTPYEPVVLALRDLLFGLGAAAPAGRGRGGHLLRRLLPQLSVEDEEDGEDAEQIFDRYEMFEAMISLLQDLADGRDLLVVIDDLHWADTSSLQLLNHLIRHPARARLLCTTRSASFEESTALSRFLVQLDRDDLLMVTELQGLDLVGAHALLRSTGSPPLPSGVVSSVVAGTGGSPYLLCELAKSLSGDPASGGHLVARPEEIAPLLQQAVVRRVRQLGSATVDLLEAACTVGQEFDLDLLARVCDQPMPAVTAMAQAAAAAGVLAPVSTGSNRFVFSHALVRSAMTESIAAHRRAALHRRVGSALAQEPTDASTLAEIAGHLTRSAQADAALAADYAERAAAAAFGLLGFAEAARHYQTALDLLALGGPDDLRRCRLLLRRGEALLADYAIEGCRQCFSEASTLALKLGAEPELARAVMGWVAVTEFGTVDPVAERFLEAAADGAPPSTSGWGRSTQALLQAGRARLLSPDDARRTGLLQQAEQLARSGADSSVQAFVLATALLVNWSPANIEWRRRTVAEARRLSESSGASELTTELVNLESAFAAECGALGAARIAEATLTDRAQRSRRPFLVALDRMRKAGRALMLGDYRQAERWSDEMLAMGHESPNFVAARLAHVVMIGRDQGHVQDAVPDVRRMVDLTDRPEWQATLALAHLETGERRAGQELYERHARVDFSSVPADWLWLATTCHLAECAVLIGDSKGADTLRAQLAPFRERNAVVAHGVASLGAVARVSAGLAATTGRVEDAYADYLLALDLNASWSAWPWLVRTQVSFAKLLTRHRALQSLPGTPAPDALRRLASGRAADLGMALPESAGW